MKPHHRPTKSRRAIGRPQRGEVLILTLLVLLVLYLGFLFTMRGVMSEAQLTGNNLAKQKTAQVADIALRQVEATVFASYGGQPLEISATSLPWYRAVVPGTAGPASAYWQSCLGNTDATQRCASVPVSIGNTGLNYSALAVLQPTGRSDPHACSRSQFTALYYDVFLYVTENTGATGVPTETVIKLCILS